MSDTLTNEQEQRARQRLAEWGTCLGQEPLPLDEDTTNTTPTPWEPRPEPR